MHVGHRAAGAPPVRLRYQVGPDPGIEPFVKAAKHNRFATLDEALAIAAWRMATQQDDPPHFVIDTATQRPVGAGQLVRLCAILAGKQGDLPGDIPTFRDSDGGTHLGIKA